MPSQLVEASNYSPSIFSAPTAIAAGSIFVLGLFVLARERVTPISAAFFMVTFTVTIWLICSSGVSSAANEATAAIWSKAAYLGIPFIAPATYLFTLLLLGIYRQHRYVVWASWLTALLFTIGAIATDALVSGMNLYWWGYYTAFGWLGLPFILFFGGLLVASMAHYWLHYRTVGPGRRRQRIRSLMLAFGVGYAGIVDFVPTYGVPLYPFGYLAIFGFVLLAARAIWAYHLPAITPAFAANEIIDTMGEALLVLDTSGVVRVANSAACDLFESARGELVGKPVSSAIDRASFGERLQRIVWTGEVREREMDYLSKSGEHSSLSISATIAGKADNEPIGVVCVVRDITGYKRAEAEIRHLNENLETVVARRTTQLEETNQELQSEIVERRRVEDERAELLISEQLARSDAEEGANARQLLLSIVSHDLRNPLSAMRGSTLFLQSLIESNKSKLDSPLETSLRTSLVRMESAASKMNRLIDELLDLGRLQAGQPLDLYRQDIDLVELARRVVENHQHYVDRHSIVLKAVPTLQGRWDPLRLERALDNLVSNAIKYSPRGGEVLIEVSAELSMSNSAHDEKPCGCAVITVRDQGMGIPVEDLPHIFDWFHRATNVSGRISGTGIGLSTVRQTVEQHGGSIAVESVEGRGTTVTLRLPLSPDDPAAARSGKR